VNGSSVKESSSTDPGVGPKFLGVAFAGGLAVGAEARICCSNASCKDFTYSCIPGEVLLNSSCHGRKIFEDIGLESKDIIYEASYVPQQGKLTKILISETKHEISCQQRMMDSSYTLPLTINGWSDVSTGSGN
jgi:hypothetical protein